MAEHQCRANEADFYNRRTPKAQRLPLDEPQKSLVALWRTDGGDLKFFYEDENWVPWWWDEDEGWVELHPLIAIGKYQRASQVSDEEFNTMFKDRKTDRAKEWGTLKVDPVLGRILWPSD